MRKPWRTPYRWIPRCWWTNIRSNVMDIGYGVKNVIRWAPVIWFDADFDWSYLATVMEYKLRRMSESFSKHGHHINSDRYARQTLICAELLKRMNGGDFYFDNASKRYPDKERQWSKHIAESEKNDQEYLALMFKKYLRHWWD